MPRILTFGAFQGAFPAIGQVDAVLPDADDREG